VSALAMIEYTDGDVADEAPNICGQDLSMRIRRWVNRHVNVAGTGAV